MTRVSVKDFGPISLASIELKPLTVFIGPNNSGKSYLALAIYCLSRTLSSEPPLGRMRPSLGGWPGHRVLSGELMKQTEAEIQKAWPNARSFPRGPIKVGDMPKGLRDVVANATRRLADTYSSDFGREVVRCYGTEIASLVRRGKASDAAQLEVGLSQPANGLVWRCRQPTVA